MSADTTPIPAGVTSTTEKPALYDLLDRAAAELRTDHALAWRYTAQDLADALLPELTAPAAASGSEDELDAAVDAALELLVHDRIRDLAKVDHLIDETPTGDAAIDAMAKTLLATIRQQGHQYYSLGRLVVREIAVRAANDRQPWLAPTTAAADH